MSEPTSGQDPPPWRDERRPESSGEPESPQQPQEWQPPHGRPVSGWHPSAPGGPFGAEPEKPAGQEESPEEGKPPSQEEPPAEGKPPSQEEPPAEGKPPGEGEPPKPGEPPQAGEPPAAEEPPKPGEPSGPGEPPAPQGPDGPPGGRRHIPPPMPERRRRKWPWAVLGSGLALVFALVAVAVVSHNESSEPVTVKYRVTGTARDVTIAYSTWHGGGIATVHVKARTLPFRKDVTTTEFLQGGSLALNLSGSGGTARCSAQVGDGKVHTATATGRFGTAICRGF